MRRLVDLDGFFLTKGGEMFEIKKYKNLVLQNQLSTKYLRDAHREMEEQLKELKGEMEKLNQQVTELKQLKQK